MQKFLFMVSRGFSMFRTPDCAADQNMQNPYVEAGTCALAFLIAKLQAAVERKICSIRSRAESSALLSTLPPPALCE